LLGALAHRAVDQDMAGRVAYQVGGDAGGADIIEVAGDPERRDRAVHRLPVLAPGRRGRGNQSEDQQQQTGHEGPFITIPA